MAKEKKQAEEDKSLRPVVIDGKSVSSLTIHAIKKDGGFQMQPGAVVITSAPKRVFVVNDEFKLLETKTVDNGQLWIYGK